MEAYTDFALVYDTFMDDTPYGEWAEYLVGLLKKYGVSETGSSAEDESRTEGRNSAEDESGTEDGDGAESRVWSSEETVRRKALAAERNVVVDLGCGTGTLTELLADAGYDMIGIDCSQEMLNIAFRKKEESGREILYLNQDMRELELFGAVGAVVSVCDSLNYILEEEELTEIFRLVNNYLYPGGVFVFDFNTVYKYETVIGNTTIAENREDCSFIWENFYDPEEELNEYEVTVFVRLPEEVITEAEKGLDGDGGEGIFRRFTETHFQRGYTLGQMRRLVELAGMTFVAAFDADTHEAPVAASERIYIVARECGKEVVK